MEEPEGDDIITDREKNFPLPELLDLEYFKKYRRWYYRQSELGKHHLHRNYLNLITYIAEIYEYNPDHAKAFAKALRSSEADWGNSEAIFAEVIVYRYYIRLAYEGIIKSISLDHQECDLILERLDGSRAFLEVFSIKPDFGVPGVVYDVKTHTQEAMGSVRQKLINKIRKQRQMSQPRDNYAVIELNDISIAGNFTILSSLSSGYKIWIDKATMKKTDEGYDWNGSIFEDESTKHLKGIIHFDLGDYESRRFIYNWNFVRP